MAESMVDVALLAFGGPADLQLIPDFLVRMTGRTPSDETLAVVRERYTAIGGASPLPDITARQARALQASLVQQLAFPLRVRHGFLFAEPGVPQCLADLDGNEILALPLSPFGSRQTRDRYRKALDEAGATEVPILEGWYAGRGFVKAVSKRIAEALDGSDPSEWAVLFTAHNIPLENVLEGDPYVDQLQQTIAQLVPQVTPGDWRFAFQSKGRSGGEWLEPEADEVVRALAADGWEKLLVVPVGFVSDNVETLYDLDIELRSVVEANGMEYRRSTPPNDMPYFIETLADVVVDHLARRPVEHQLHRPDEPHPHG
jgi:ferrochelatase